MASLPPSEKIVDVQDIWSVHCYAGDYNPLHNHLCDTLQGLSGILYTKIPPTIQTSTTLDGCLEFVFGHTPATGSLIFMFSQSSIRRPAVGDIYLLAWTHGLPIRRGRWTQVGSFQRKPLGHREIKLKLNREHTDTAGSSGFSTSKSNPLTKKLDFSLQCPMNHKQKMSTPFCSPIDISCT